MNRQIDEWGRVLFDGDDAIELLFRGHDITGLSVLSSAQIIEYNAVCVEHDKLEYVIDPVSAPSHTPRQDATRRQETWWMPEAYKELDVRAKLLRVCQSQAEENRVTMELAMFESRGLLMVLRLMCFLVDHWRENGVVWGVGRGSSVASHCLFLIGVHHINALKYDLDIREFLKVKNFLDVVQGSLIVIAHAPPIKGRAAWLCRCECGRELVITQTRLMNGITRCDPARHPRERYKVGAR